MTNSAAPLVTIGVPVHNEQANLESAVHSLLRQTHTRIEVVISDNASTDETRRVAERLADSDRRIRYVRQDTNIGAVGNFRFVLSEARGEFFMWAAADDRWEPTFVERNVARLEADPDLVGSISKVRWRIDGADGGLAPGTAALEGTVRANVKEYLRTARDNSRFYALFRTEILVACYPANGFFALDLATMLATLKHGNHAEVPQVLMTRGRNDPSSYIHSVEHDNRPGMDSWFPLLPFTRHVVRELKIPLSPTTIGLLVVRNGYEHLRFAATREGLYGRLAGFVIRLSTRFELGL